MAGRRHRGSVALVALAGVLVAVGSLAAGGAATPLAAPRAPTVSGPRETTATRPVYTFRSPRAVSYRCAFDTAFLHRCARRYSQALEPGAHVLRVRAVTRARKLSKVAVVRVQVRLAVPSLQLGAPIAVGPGAGVPAVGGGAIWVPTTGDGMLARVDLGSGTVAARVRVGPEDSEPGDLDSAVFTGGSVWASSDAGATIARVDPATNTVSARLATASRPGGLAVGGGFVWAFHFLQSTVTRVDVAGNAVRTFEVPGLAGTGIAYESGSLWLLSEQPARVFRLDPATGAVQQTINLEIPFPARRAIVGTWWLSSSDGAVWAVLTNHRGVARVDAASGGVRYTRLPHGDPFGIAAGGGHAWVATDRAVWKLDGTTGEARAASLIPTAPGFGLVSITYGDGAAWLSDYGRGTLMRMS